MLRHRLAGTFLLCGIVLTGFVLPAHAQGSQGDLEQVAILGTNSVHINTGATVTGDVVANDASPGPVLDEGAELAVDRAATVNGDLSGDSIDLDRDATVNGDLYYNELAAGRATINGSQFFPLDLPVFPSLPAFQQAQVRPTAVDVTVGPGQTVSLPEGSYRDIRIDRTGRLVFLGGIYDVRSIGSVSTIGGQCAFPCRMVHFEAPTQLRIEGTFHLEKDSQVGPAPGSEISAASIIVYAAGTNLIPGNPASLPTAVYIERDSEVDANFYVPNGTFRIDQGSIVDGISTSTLDGAILARDVSIQKNVHVTVDSFFRNRAPTADPQDVFTNGVAPITITLTGSDPDNDDLTFQVVGCPKIDADCTGALEFPARGTLSQVVEGPEPFPGDPPGCNPVNTPGCISPDPPRTSATLAYTPATGDDEQNSFVFQVTDTGGKTGMATVKINPPPVACDDGSAPPCDPPPPIQEIVARPASAEVAKNRSVVIPLRADAPDGISLTFSIVAGSGPSNGALSALTQGTETPQRSAKVTYTPNLDYFGPDSFVFEACDSAMPLDCATAAASIEVIDAKAVANPQEVTTPENTAIDITLTGAAGLGGGGAFGGSGLVTLLGKAAFLDPAEIAGGVEDTNGDGFGDQATEGGRLVYMASDPASTQHSAILPFPNAASLLAANATRWAGQSSTPATACTEAASGGTFGTDVDGMLATENITCTLIATGDLDTTDLSAYDVLYVAALGSTGIPDLVAAAANIQSFVDAGGGLVVEAEIFDAAAWTWVPFADDIGHSGTANPETNDVAIVSGQEGHPVLAGLTTASLSNWGSSAHGFFDTPGAAGFTVLTTRTDTLHSGKAHVIVREGLPEVVSASLAGDNTGVRIQIEWDVAGFDTTDLVTADVIVSTVKGSGQSADTAFYVGTAEQDGVLTPDDYEAPAEPIAGAVMPVPDVPDGTEGTFSFDVLTQLVQVRTQDNPFDVFSIQGRVNLDEVGAGLGVRTTAATNVANFMQPQLSLTTPGVVPDPLTYSIISLPLNGKLLDSTGTQITTVPTTLVNTKVTFVPNAGFTGTSSFTFQVADATTATSATALIEVIVGSANCFNGIDANGRPCI